MLGNHMKPFDSSVTVLTAVHKIISMYERLQLMRVDVYPSGDQPATQRTQLDLEDLHQLELAQLSEFGYFLVAHCVDGAANTTTPPAALGRGAHTPVLQAGGSVALVNTFDVMMAATPLQFPPRSPAGRFDYDIFNSLLDELKALGLGWDDADAAGSGKDLLTALKSALQYALPFDMAGVLAKRAMHIPDRWRADVLEV